MNSFSVQLESYMQQKDIKTYALAQYCGIDRSNMYKMVNGKRTPSSRKIAEQMADYMQLKPSERQDFLDAYEIAVLGHDTFYRRKSVVEFMNAFHSHTLRMMQDIFSKEFTSIHVNPDFLAENNGKLFQSSELTVLLHSILTYESTRENGHICMVMQPDATNLTEMIMTIGERNPRLIIDHIICLNDTHSVGHSLKDANIEIMEHIVPIFAHCSCIYRPYCYYDNLSVLNSQFSLFSSMILTSEYAVLFSKKRFYGVLLSDPDTVASLKNQFQTMVSDTRPLAGKIMDLAELLSYFTSVDFTLPGVEFQPESCMMPFITAEMAAKYLNPEVLQDSILQDAIGNYLEHISFSLGDPNCSFFFSENGIRTFLKTGRISEIPRSLYTPLDPADRIRILELVKKCCLEGKYRMLSSESALANCEICLYATFKQGYILLPSTDKDQVYIRLVEPAILEAFTDCLSNIPAEELYEPRDAGRVIEDLILDYLNKK